MDAPEDLVIKAPHKVIKSNISVTTLAFGFSNTHRNSLGELIPLLASGHRYVFYWLPITVHIMQEVPTTVVQIYLACLNKIRMGVWVVNQNAIVSLTALPQISTEIQIIFSNLQNGIYCMYTSYPSPKFKNWFWYGGTQHMMQKQTLITIF